MSQELEIWFRGLQKELTEGVPMARRVRLVTVGDATVWQTWEPVQGIDAAQWGEEAEALLASLKGELPKRRVQLNFVAEDQNGASLSNKPRTVTGVNESAQDLGTQNGAKALAEAMASVGRLMDATLESARKFMQFQSDQNERLSNQLAEAHEVFMAIKKVELESEEQQSQASKIMLEQVQQGLPMLMKVIEHIVTHPKEKGIGSAVAAAANATTNGVPS